jgi:hypothetical protein
MRKNAILFLALFAISSSCFAQFKVHSTGQVSITTTALPSNNAKLTIGDTTNIASNENTNLHSCLYTVQDKTNIGVNGIVLRNNADSYGSVIGVRGQARGGAYGRCFGVLGNLHPYDFGAAVFGGVDSPQGVVVPGRYAGYFYGGVYVTSYITAQAFHTSSDRELKENITPFGQSDDESTLDHILKMNVVEYTYKDIHREGGGVEASSAKETQEEKKLHYGLIAQELREIYPELVNKEQDGYLSINYVELVPVLIRSIQELKQELDEIKGNSEDIVMSRMMGSTFEDVTASVDATEASSVSASLSQNTPNPFTEQTTIRFTLPDEAQNASICIFDMSGKMLRQIPVSPSMHSITIKGYELQAGMYIYSLLISGKEILTKRMILSKQ